MAFRSGPWWLIVLSLSSYWNSHSHKPSLVLSVGQWQISLMTLMRKHHHEAGRGAVLARSYDYVIVGAGTAGCGGGRRVGDGPDAPVLLRGAGPGEAAASLSTPPQWVENLGSRYDWAYHYEPSPHVAGRSIPLPLGKVLGGSGSINAMVWTRGHRADYDGWAEAGNAGWDFHSVLPLFQKAEDWEDG